MNDTLFRLEQTIRARREADPSTSYVAKLRAKGRGKIAQKLGEEAVETVIAALTEDKASLTGEAADLLFHLLALLVDCDVSLADVCAELDRREGVSGLDEKAARRPDKRIPGETDMAIDPTQPYDDSNIFARILRGEIPNKTVYEDEHVLAFQDINPQAPTHILVIPKGPYVSWDDFSAKASEAEIAAFVRAVGKVAREAGLVEPGYRLLANVGQDGHQEVPHLHVHLFAGRPLGPMLAR